MQPSDELFRHRHRHVARAAAGGVTLAAETEVVGEASLGEREAQACAAAAAGEQTPEPVIVTSLAASSALGRQDALDLFEQLVAHDRGMGAGVVHTLPAQHPDVEGVLEQ